VLKKFFKMIVCATLLLSLCGCNVMVLSQHLKMYAKAVEYRYVAQEIMHRVKTSVADRMVIDRAKTLYAAAAFNGDAFTETLQHEARANSLDSESYEQFSALIQAFNELEDFIPDTVSNFNTSSAACRSMAACKVDAEAKGKEAAQEIRVVINDKTRTSEDRIGEAVLLFEKNRWPEWDKI